MEPKKSKKSKDDYSAGKYSAGKDGESGNSNMGEKSTEEELSSGKKGKMKIKKEEPDTGSSNNDEVFTIDVGSKPSKKKNKKKRKRVKTEEADGAGKRKV